MKKLFVLAALLISATMFAQKNNVIVDKGTWTTSLGVSLGGNPIGLAGPISDAGMQGSYYLADGLAVRTKLGFGLMNSKENKDDNYWSVVTKFHVGAGVQKTLVTSRNLHGYVGCDLNYYSLGVKENSPESSVTFEKTSENMVSIKPFVGIEYHFVPNFFIGVEWGCDTLLYSEKFSDSDHSPEKVDGMLSVGLFDLSAASLKLGFCF